MFELVKLRMRTAQEAYLLMESIHRTNTKDGVPNRLVSIGLKLAVTAGAGLWFASFGAFLAPWLFGLGWFDAIAAFVAAQVASRVFMDVPQYYHKAMAVVWIVVEAARGKEPAKQLQDHRTIIFPDAMMRKAEALVGA